MESLMRYINRTARLAALYRNEKLKAYGLTDTHHTYILNLCRNPGITQEQLAELIYVHKSNVARQLAVLESNGYIRRSPSPHDGREILVHPTEKAHDIYPLVVSLLQEWNQSLLADFSEEEQRELMGAMKKIMLKARDMVDTEPEEKRKPKE